MADLKRSPGHVSRGRTIQYQKNRILAALPREDFKRLAPYLTAARLPYKLSIYTAGERIDRVASQTAASVP